MLITFRKVDDRPTLIETIESLDTKELDDLTIAELEELSNVLNSLIERVDIIGLAKWDEHIKKQEQSLIARLPKNGKAFNFDDYLDRNDIQASINLFHSAIQDFCSSIEDYESVRILPPFKEECKGEHQLAEKKFGFKKDDFIILWG